MTNAEREAGLLSDRYYNEALNRARIRDLTGAAEKLRVSLQLNKKNVQARNLYGLVLYERGETVAALREWILSQNIQPAMNSASQYIRSVEKEASKLKQMSRGISDYNEALRNCQDGNDDVASLRLRRAIQKNPRLIDAQLLLALINIRERRFNQAKRLLNRVLKTDRFNPQAVRYLQEIAEQTGNPADRRTPVEDDLSDEARNGSLARQRTAGTRNIFRVGNDFSPAVNIIFGVAVGLLAACLLIVPAVRSSAVKNNNDRIVELTTTIDAQNSQIDELNNEISTKDETISSTSSAQNEVQKTSDSAEHLLKALQASYNEDYETALTEVDQVDEDCLTADEKTIYESLSSSLSDQAFDVYKNLGDTAYYQKDYKSAASYYEKALATGSNDYDTLVLLVSSYEGLGDKQKQMETWQKIADAYAGTDNGTYAQTMADNLADELGVSTTDTGSDTSDSTGTGDTTMGGTGTTGDTNASGTAGDTNATGTTGNANTSGTTGNTNTTTANGTNTTAQ